MTLSYWRPVPVREPGERRMWAVEARDGRRDKTLHTHSGSAWARAHALNRAEETMPPTFAALFREHAPLEAL